MRSFICFLAITIFLPNSLFKINAQATDKKTINKISVNDDYKYIAINDVLMWISNNGDGCNDPNTNGNGFYWPTGAPISLEKSAIYEDGLLYGGKVNGQIRVNGNTHRQGLQAGKILENGEADDPSLTKYRVYRIRKDWQSFPPGDERDNLKKDLEEWPVEDGAPWDDVDGDGIFTRGTDKPKFDGDEVLWYVANDLDTARTHFTYGSEPMGLEFQTTVYGFFGDSSTLFGSVVFKKYKIINKSSNTIEDMYFSYWTDDDLGDAADDFVGCDTSLNLGYAYNASNNDGTYGTPPPAVGHLFLQTPIVPGTLYDSAYFNGEWRKGSKNIPLSSFVLYIGGNSVYRDPYQGNYQGTTELYNYMQGKIWNGADFIDPNTNNITRFVTSGDPNLGTGWYEGPGWQNGPAAGDRRSLLSSGTFNMAPGDTQEVVVAILMSQGTTNLKSITTLKRDASLLKEFYTKGFSTLPEIGPPIVNSASEDSKIILWWLDEKESFETIDKLISYKGFTDSTYNFEGYKVYQYSDSLGSDPVLINIFDIKNDVFQVKDYVVINGIREYITVLNSPNEGLQRFLSLDRDVINNQELLNGSPYYFGISTYAYSPNSFTKIIESVPKILTVIPGRKPIDITYHYSSGDTISLQPIAGNSDVAARLVVLSPNELTGNTYELAVMDSSSPDYFAYNLINKTSGDTIIKKSYENESGNSEKKVFDGMFLIVDMKDRYFFRNNKIKNVLEINGPGGEIITNPVNVFNQLNSTGSWKITASNSQGTPSNYLELLKLSGTGSDDIEIRFTQGGSEYYTGLPNSSISINSPKGKGRVPFEAWLINRDKTLPDVRLFIKIRENSQTNYDSSWSVNPITKQWESIFVYTNLISYIEPLANTSGTVSSIYFQAGNISIVGDLPQTGTVVRINTHKPPQTGDIFSAVATAPFRHNIENAKQNINAITIFPNPYFGSNDLEAGGTERIVRMTNLPQQVTARIYSLAGVFIKRLVKDDPTPWLDWDLKNEYGNIVGSGIYLLYLDMPGIGSKILKLAVVQSN